jgi:hypothetical protein
MNFESSQPVNLFVDTNAERKLTGWFPTGKKKQFYGVLVNGTLQYLLVKIYAPQNATLKR